MNGARVLVTNDDGIDSAGLHALARAAISEGLDVVIAAPDSEMSGASASITAHDADAVTAAGGRGRVRVEHATIAGLDIAAHRVHAAPALIALLAAHGAFGAAPDLVLSGINLGANVGRAILHSGTVGAALAGALNGARGLAVSLDVRDQADPHHWETAATMARLVMSRVLAAPVGTIVNLNVPNVGSAVDLTLREAPLAHFGIVHTTVTDRDDDQHVVLEITDPDDPAGDGTDAALLLSGSATLTSLLSVSESGEAFLGKSLGPSAES